MKIELTKTICVSIWYISQLGLKLDPGRPVKEYDDVEFAVFFLKRPEWRAVRTREELRLLQRLRKGGIQDAIMDMRTPSL